MKYIISRHSINYSLKDYCYVINSIFNTEYKNIFHKKTLNKTLKNIFHKDFYFFSSMRQIFYFTIKYFKENNKNKILFSECGFSPLINAARELDYSIDFYKTDINGESELSNLKEKINNFSPDIFVLSHNFGNIDKNSNTIKELCKNNNILLIEDQAHSLANYKIHGDISLFSFGTGKDIVALGGGGICFDKDLFPALKKYLDKLKIFSQDNYSLIFPLLESTLSRKYIYPFLLFPFFYIINILNRKKLEGLFIEENNSKEHKLYNMLPIQYKLANKQIIKLDKLIRHRKKICSIYKNISNFRLIKNYSFLMAAIDCGSEERKWKTLKYLMKNGIDCRNDYITYYNENILKNRLLYLPSHHEVTENKARFIVNLLNKSNI